MKLTKLLMREHVLYLVHITWHAYITDDMVKFKVAPLHDNSCGFDSSTDVMHLQRILPQFKGIKLNIGSKTWCSIIILFLFYHPSYINCRNNIANWKKNIFAQHLPHLEKQCATKPKFVRRFPSSNQKWEGDHTTDSPLLSSQTCIMTN